MEVQSHAHIRLHYGCKLLAKILKHCGKSAIARQRNTRKERTKVLEKFVTIHWTWIKKTSDKEFDLFIGRV